MKNIFQYAIKELISAFQPILAIKEGDNADKLFKDLGYFDLADKVNILKNNLDIESLEKITLIVKTIELENIDPNKIKDLVAGIISLIDSFKKVGEVVAKGANHDVSVDDFVSRLLEYLLADYFYRRHRVVYEWLFFLGIAEENDVSDKSLPRKSVNLSQIIKILTDPSSLLTDTYGWGGEFRSKSFINNTSRVSAIYGIPGGPYGQPPQRANLTGNEKASVELRLPILQSGYVPWELSQFGITLSPLNEKDGLAEGLALIPFFVGAKTFSYKLSKNLEVDITTNTELDGLALSIMPKGVDIITKLVSNLSVSVNVTTVEDFYDSEKIILGSAEKSRLSFQKIGGGLYALHEHSELDLGLTLDINSLKLIINGSEGDGFISSILSAIDTEAEANLSLGWSTLSGFTLEGGANLQVQLNTHIDLGFLKVTALIISLGPEEKSLGLDVGANLELNLGPLKATIKDIGLDSNLLFEPGNLGPVNLDTGFKPPTGVGLSIDAAVIKGGGYLAFDTAREEYTGALELVINEFISVKAIGVITTRMPDGSKGFSMLLVLTAEFSTGLQLGMGFTLNGVGGLLGLNRTVNQDVLIDSITTGGAQKIMFPKDVIANAPRIISDLQTFFPAKKDTFLIGPMARLGWGTPTLVTLDLGVIIELPDVNTIVILGKLALNLPDADSPLLKLNIVFMGMFEADKQRAWFYGQLVDSKLLSFTLDGGMGFLVEWDNDPEFIITAGGFHPQYKPPGTLPAPFLNIPRMGISILDEPWGKIRAVSYFAVTSNTVQMGALAELYFKFGPFQVKGHIGYDALFQFDPFFFIIDVSAGVSVKFFGAGVFTINLEFSLQGPTPWRVKGYGSIKILFIRLRARFDETWGDALDTHLEPIDVTKLLVEQLESPANWRPILPASSHLLVSLRTTESDGDNLLLHPVGSLAVSQTAVPLNFDLDRVGQKRPKDYDRFELTADDEAGLEVDKETLTAPFAIAQYKDLSNEEKLSMQSFDKLPSGISIGSAQGNQTVRAVNRVIRYETEIMDCNGQQISVGLMGIGREFFGTVVLGSATYKSELSVHAGNKILNAPKFTFSEEVYVLVNKANNKVHQQDEQALLFDTEAEAFDFMRREERSNPRLKGQLLVVPEFDVVGEAA